jgi:ribonuclease-3
MLKDYYVFKNPALFFQAVTHSSYKHEKGLSSDNERLEFLGDTVLDAAVAGILFRTFPALGEGELSKIKSSLVCQASLARIAEKVELPELLFLGQGETQQGGSNKPRILADAFEALVGAVYLDGGYEKAEQFVHRLFNDEVAKAAYAKADPKTELQEFTQKHYKTLPKYTLIGVTGQDHSPLYEVEVSLNGKFLGATAGTTKKSAEQGAAKIALRKLGYE